MQAVGWGKKEAFDVAGVCELENAQLNFNVKHPGEVLEADLAPYSTLYSYQKVRNPAPIYYTLL